MSDVQSDISHFTKIGVVVVHRDRRDKHRRPGTNAAIDAAPNTAHNTRAREPNRATRTGTHSGNDDANHATSASATGSTANESGCAAGNYSSTDRKSVV